MVGFFFIMLKLCCTYLFLFSKSEDYPCYILKDYIVGADGAKRGMGQEEWAALADFQNEMQENKNIETTVFTTLGVCATLYFIFFSLLTIL